MIFLIGFILYFSLYKWLRIGKKIKVLSIGFHNNVEMAMTYTLQNFILELKQKMFLDLYNTKNLLPKNKNLKWLSKYVNMVN